MKSEIGDVRNIPKDSIFLTKDPEFYKTSAALLDPNVALCM